MSLENFNLDLSEFPTKKKKGLAGRLASNFFFRNLA